MKREKIIRKFKAAVDNQIAAIQKILQKDITSEDGAIFLAKKEKVGVTFIEGSGGAIFTLFEEACKRDKGILSIMREVVQSFDTPSISSEDLIREVKLNENITDLSDEKINEIVENLLKNNNIDGEEE